METQLMTREDSELLDYLLSADFNAGSGMSYGEALGMLQQYQRLYRLLYSNYYHKVQQENNYERTINKLDEQIALLNNKLAVRDFQISNLEEALTRKLTWKERIFGKLKL